MSNHRTAQIETRIFLSICSFLLLVLAFGWDIPIRASQDIVLRNEAIRYEESLSGCTIPPEDLISWWPGEGNADDIIGPNQGILMNAVEFVPGMVGQAFKFTGTSYINIPDTGFPMDSAPRTLALWMKPNYDARVSFEYGVQAPNNSFYIQVPGSVACIGQDGGWPAEPCGSTNIADGNWHHIALTFDGVYTATLYVDGSVEVIDNKSYHTTSIGVAHIGAYDPLVNNGFDNFKGLVDEVSIFGRALSGSEIQTIYNAGSEGMCISGLGSSKEVDKTLASSGDIVNYQITAHNYSDVTINTVAITDTLPASLTYIDDSLSATSGSYAYQDGTITWTGPITVSQGVTITFGARISFSVPVDSSITNTALIQVGDVTTTRSAVTKVIPHKLFLPCLAKPCLPLYSDDFSNSSSGWPVGDYTNYRFDYLNGEYRILIRPSQYGAAARPGFQASDYTVSVALRNPNNVMGSYGIAFGIAQDWSTFYTLEIYPDGWYGIYRWDPSAVVTLSEAFSPAILQGTATNQIKVKRSGASIHAYANGQLLANVTDGTYTGMRYLGLLVFSYNKPNVDIRFDNFTIYPSSCDGTNSTSDAAYEWQPSLEQRYFNFDIRETGHSEPQR